MRYCDLLLEYNKSKLIQQYEQVFDQKVDIDNSAPEGIQSSLSQLDLYLQQNNIQKTIDPYIKWIVHRYVINGIRYWEDVFAKVIPALVTYDKLKRKKKLQANEMDINQIKSESELLDLIDKYREEELSSGSSKEKEIEQKFYDIGEAELVLNNNEYKIVIPKTTKASCYFGRNTRWCTASTEGNNYFTSYRAGPLIIVLHKPTNRRWQFYFTKSGTADQYMNEKDQPINLKRFKKEHLSIMKFLAEKFNVKNPKFLVTLYGNKLSDEMKKYIVKRNPMLIAHFKQTEELQLTSLKHDRHYYNSEDLYKLFKNPSDKVKITAIKNNSHVIKHIKNPTEKMKEQALKSSWGRALFHIKNPSEELKNLAMNIDPGNIGLIKNPSEEMQLKAVKNDPINITLIDNPTEKTQLLAVRKRPTLIGDFENPAESVQLDVIKRYPTYIEYIKNPSKKAIQLAKENLHPNRLERVMKNQNNRYNFFNSTKSI